MPIKAEFDYSGVSRDNYDNMIPEVETKLRAAPGFMAHLAMESPRGFRVIEVWETQEALDAWIRDTIAPMMQGAGGSAPPAQTAPIHHMIVR